MKQNFFLVFIFLIFVAQASISAQDKAPAKGAIYGKIEFQYEPMLQQLTIKIEKVRRVIKPKRNGIFFIDNLAKGIYKLTICIKNNPTWEIGGISVSPDSVTILKLSKLFSNVTHYNILKDTWKIKKKDMIPRTISGHVLLKGRSNNDVEVTLKGTFLSSKVESNGFFSIKDILPGNYILYSTLVINPMFINTYGFIQVAKDITNIKIFCDSLEAPLENMPQVK